MSFTTKFKNQIDWDYNINDNILKRSNKKQRIVKNSFKGNIDFANFKAKNNLKDILKNNNMPSKKNYASIYYGILFVLIFGLMFFLTISIGFASTNKNIDYNVDNFYDNEKSFELLEQYIINSDKEDEETVDKNKIENNIEKKIDYIKYRVKNNDTIDKISKKYGLWTDTILLVNNLKYDKHLKIGSFIIIPNQNGRIITVQQNDSVYKIADKYGISWQKIVDANDLKSASINPGTKIFVPDSKMTKYEREKYYTQKFICPFKNGISSYFGPRIDPFTGTYGFHAGIDLKANMGDKIKNIKDGKILFIGWDNVYGNFIIAKYNDNVIVTYGHLSKIFVDKNQIVKQNDILGLVGSTGRSTGPHLHFEVRKNGKLIDPLTILN